MWEDNEMIERDPDFEAEADRQWEQMGYDGPDHWFEINDGIVNSILPDPTMEFGPEDPNDLPF